jgi:hypothetical protein
MPLDKSIFLTVQQWFLREQRRRWVWQIVHFKGEMISPDRTTDKPNRRLQMFKTSIAILAVALSVSALDVSSAEAGKRKNFANGGNGGNFNLVIGNGNRVGNGGRGGNIISGLLGGFGGGHRHNSANGGNGGSFNVVIGNNNSVGNGGNGGNILDF